MGRRSKRRRRDVPQNHPLKLSRAQHHLKDFKACATRWIKAAEKTITENPAPKAPYTYEFWIDPPALPADDLSLIVGDCLQCLRTALDHLAFELASAFTFPMTDDIEKDSEFPILSDVDRHGNFGAGPHKWSSSKPMVCGMDPDAQTVIEGLQPYKRGNAYTDDPLWRLHELNRIDKHRLLHVVGASFE